MRVREDPGRPRPWFSNRARVDGHAGREPGEVHLSLNEPALGPVRARRARRGLGVPGQEGEQGVTARSLVDEKPGPPSVGLEAVPHPLRTCHELGEARLRTRECQLAVGAPARPWRLGTKNFDDPGAPVNERDCADVTFGDDHWSALPSSTLVFTAPGGGPLRYNNWLTRVWHPALEKVRLPKVGVHVLRHSAAARIVQAGGSPKTLQTVLGHRSAAFSLTVYAHLFDADLDALADRLERPLRRAE